MNMGDKQRQDYCALLARSLGGEVEECERLNSPPDGYKKVRIVILFATEDQAKAAEAIVEEKIEHAMNVLKDVTPDFDVKSP